MIDDVRKLFASSFSGDPDIVARAPGRVNLIGEHTDYNDGFVLPCAIGKQTIVALRTRKDNLINLVAGNLKSSQTSFRIDEPIEADGSAPWSNYVRGMASLLIADGYNLPGMDAVILGDIPQGAGLSSSAALENASGLAFAAIAGCPDIDRTQLALYGQRAEHEFAGCNCGIMDQLVSARAHAGNALLIDCRSLETKPVFIPDDLAILIVHSGVSRGLVDGEYNLRRVQCEAAARHYGVAMLRDLDALPAQGGLDSIAYARARHVITENARTLASAQALACSDIRTLSALMAESHASMRNDFQITVPAIDHLVSILNEAIGVNGGVRMTGGGFGGAVVALVAKGSLDYAIAAVSKNYQPPNGQALHIMIEQASEGASLII